MSIFIIGLLLFLGIHSVSIVNDSWRDVMVSKIGEWPWKGLYSLISILGFVFIIWGYGSIRYNTGFFYTPPVWLQYFSLLLLLPVFPLLIATYVPGRIKTATRHPMLLATQLWAAAHLCSNGSIVNVILFSSVLVWAIMDRISMSHRPQRSIPGAPYSSFNDIIACVIGLGLYLAFIFWLHELLIGVPLY